MLILWIVGLSLTLSILEAVRVCAARAFPWRLFLRRSPRDLCFTRDVGFANNVRQGGRPSRLKLLRVTLQQKPQDEFVSDFISVFRASDWDHFHHGDDWP